MGNITSADAVLTLAVQAIFPVPQQIQGFSTDDVYDIPTIKSVEALMGVDGVLSSGFVFTAMIQEIMLQADSASNAFFDTWWTQMQAAKIAYSANGLIKLPAISTKFVQTNGFLTGYKMPGAKRTLTARRYEITWQRIAPSPS